MSRTLQYLTKYPFIFSLTIASLVVNFCIFLLGIAFETNDDALMMHISAGSISGQGSAYIIYSHYYLGQIYVWLYNSFPGYNWYPILLVFIHWISLSFILYFCLMQIKGAGRELVLFFLLLSECVLLQRLQFTSTSLLLALAGLLLCVISIQRKCLLLLILSLILLLISSLIRWESFILVLFLGFIPVLFALRMSKWPTFFLVLLFFGAGATMLRVKQNSVYTDRGGQTLMNTESALALRKIMDFPLKVNPESLNSINWTANDVQLCKQWFWADPDFYTAENMERLTEVSNYDFSVGNKLHSLLSFIKANIGFLAASLIMFFLLLKNTLRKKIVLALIPFFTVLFSFIMLERLVPRVMVPVLMTAILTIVIWSATIQFKPNRLFFYSIGFLIGFQLLANYRIIARSRQEFEAIVEVLKKHPNQLVLNKNSAMNLEGCPIWIDPRTYCLGNFLWIDVLVGYPTYQTTLEKWKINNLMSAIWERNDIYILADQVDDVTKYSKEHYGIELKANLIEREVTDNVHLFQLTKR